MDEDTFLLGKVTQLIPMRSRGFSEIAIFRSAERINLASVLPTSRVPSGGVEGVFRVKFFLRAVRMKSFERHPTAASCRPGPLSSRFSSTSKRIQKKQALRRQKDESISRHETANLARIECDSRGPPDRSTYCPRIWVSGGSKISLGKMQEMNNYVSLPPLRPAFT